MLPSTTAEPYRARIRRTLESLLQTLAQIDQRTLVLVAAFACIPLSFLVYWPRVNDFFVFDDYFFLASVRDHSFPGAMVRAFEFTRNSTVDPATPFWRPLIDVYFYAAKPAGLHAQPYHAVNFFLHGLVGALAVVLLFRLTRSAGVAAATGLLFVVAPTYDFAVSWIVQVSELLGYVFMLAALISYHEYLTHGKHQPGFAVAAFGATFFALLTKESTVILVVFLPALVLAVSPADQRRSRAEIMQSLAVPVGMIMAFAIAMWLGDVLAPERNQSIGLHMPRNLWRYLKWIVLPYRPEEFIAAREVLAALFLVVGVASIITRQQVLAFLFIWTIVAIAPFTGFDEWIEYRYTYLATLPFIAFVVVGTNTAASLLPRVAKPVAYAALAGALVLALVVTPMRTRDQQSWFAFQSHANEQVLNSVQALCGYVPPGGHIFIVRPPYFDLYGMHTPIALNLYYDHVHAAAVPELPPLAVFIENKCVIQYDVSTGTYHRTDS